MAVIVAEMTTDELQTMIEALIDRKLREWLGDPDEGLVLREELQARIMRQRTAFAAGERGSSIEDLMQRYGSA